MAVKSNFKLDARIKSMDDVQTCLQYDDSYIGERGYFATDLSELSDLSCCSHDTLAQIISDGAGDDIFRTPHDVDYDNWGSRFFVPERLLRPVEKKYKAFTLAEWIDQHEIGEVIRFRNTCNQEFNVMYLGYILDTNDDIQDVRTKGQIMFVSTPYTLQELFERYEICINGEWQPFGTEVKEDE